MANKGDWAKHEFRSLDLGDKRLDRRLTKVIGDLAASPLESIPTASEGWAETQGAYRLFHNEKVTPEGIHLGILDAEMWTRDEEQLGRHRDYAKRDFEEKETRRWRDGYRIAARAAESCPKTQVVSIGDREADMFELLLEAEVCSLQGSRPTAWRGALGVVFADGLALHDARRGDCRTAILCDAMANRGIFPRAEDRLQGRTAAIRASGASATVLGGLHDCGVANLECDDARASLSGFALRYLTDGGGMEVGLAGAPSYPSTRQSPAVRRDDHHSFVTRRPPGPQMRWPARPEVHLDRPAPNHGIRPRLERFRTGCRYGRTMTCV